MAIMIHNRNLTANRLFARAGLTRQPTPFATELPRWQFTYSFIALLLRGYGPISIPLNSDARAAGADASATSIKAWWCKVRATARSSTNKKQATTVCFDAWNLSKEKTEEPLSD